MVKKGKLLMKGKGASLFMNTIIYFAASCFCFSISLAVYVLFFTNASLFYKIEASIYVLLSPIFLYHLLSVNDAIYENGLLFGYFPKYFWRFDRIKCIEVGKLAVNSDEYRILIVHYDGDTKSVLLTELEYKNRDFLQKVIEECKKRCTRAIWIPMSLERRKEIMEKFGPVIKEKILSEKLGDWPCEMYSHSG